MTKQQQIAEVESRMQACFDWLANNRGTPETRAARQEEFERCQRKLAELNRIER